jgi:NADH-quinone oxidoreductase subunit J
MNTLLAHLDTVLLYVFALCALCGSVLMIVLRQPMRVAMALVSTMVFLGGIYGLLGVHFIAAFQVLIYVGAVMVFMVYVIMLLEVRTSYTHYFSRLSLPGALAGAALLGLLGLSVWRGAYAPAELATGTAFTLKSFSATFLSEYWLHFELTSVLLLAAVVAALAVIKAPRVQEGKDAAAPGGRAKDQPEQGPSAQSALGKGALDRDALGRDALGKEATTDAATQAPVTVEAVHG